MDSLQDLRDALLEMLKEAAFDDPTVGIYSLLEYEPVEVTKDGWLLYVNGTPFLLQLTQLDRAAQHILKREHLINEGMY